MDTVNSSIIGTLLLLATGLATTMAVSQASASEQQPGRCVVITEAGQAPKVRCNVPPSEQGKPCAIATMVATDGSIVTHYTCALVSR